MLTNQPLLPFADFLNSTELYIFFLCSETACLFSYSVSQPACHTLSHPFSSSHWAAAQWLWCMAVFSVELCPKGYQGTRGLRLFKRASVLAYEGRTQTRTFLPPERSITGRPRLWLSITEKPTIHWEVVEERMLHQLTWQHTSPSECETKSVTFSMLQQVCPRTHIFMYLLFFYVLVTVNKLTFIDMLLALTGTLGRHFMDRKPSFS